MTTTAWWVRLLSVLTAVLALLHGYGAEAASGRIIVMISSAGEPYEETVAGFRQYLDKQGVKVEYTVHQLEGDAAKAVQALRGVKTNRPDLIFAVGTLATESAVVSASDVPVVAAMILKAENLRRAPNATGVVLEVPVETQLQWIRRFLPRVRTVGVLFNPRENRDRIAAAEKAAQPMGITLDAQEVSVPQDIAAALNRLAGNAEALWGLADRTALDPQTAKQILFFSHKNRIPFIAPSSAWTKAGALYSLDWDYADMGAQCGEIGVKILRGASPASLPPAPPRTLSYSINKQTADDMMIKIPDELLRSAKTVF